MWLPKVGMFSPSKPKEINGRLYSGKAIDYLFNDKAINISLNLVEDAIEKGELITNGNYNIYHLIGDQYQVDGVFWVQLDESGRVVLVGK